MNTTKQCTQQKTVETETNASTPSTTTKNALTDLYGVRWSVSSAENLSTSPCDDTNAKHPSFDTASCLNAYLGCDHFDVRKVTKRNK
jgi:hypothetical protein